MALGGKTNAPDFGTESRYRALVQHAPLCIHEIGLDGRLLSMNPAGLRLMGCALESEVRGLRYLDAVHADDRERLGKLLARALGGEASSFEFRPELPGSPRVFSSSFVPVRDEAGRVVRLMGITEDITPRHEAEVALTRSREHLRRLIERALDLVSVVDADSVIRFQSRSVIEVLGLTPKEMEGRHFAEFVHPDDVGLVQTAVSELLERPGGSASAAYRIRHADGSWRHLESVARNLLDDPLVQGLVVNSRDVTEQRIAEAQLRQAQKMEAVGQLTGGVAHDFNNLLAVIMGNLERAAARAGGDAEMVAPIDAALAAVERGAALTQQLLTFSRKQALRPRAVDLNHHLRGMTRLLRHTLGDAIDIEVELDEATWPVRADPGQLESAVLNLALNARDAMPDGGSITIRTGREPEAAGDFSVLRMRDEGEGMDDPTRERAIEPFFTTKPSGTGLGLSMVYGFARQSGGHVRIESRPGQGTEIALFLPRSHELPKPDPAPGPAASETEAGEGRVLLVEDDPRVRRLVTAQLSGIGLEVHAAADAEEALEAVRSAGPFDALVTDVGLPGGVRGPDLAERLRAQTPALPVLLVTGHAEGGIDGHPGLDDVDVLAKPFRARDLIQRVRKLLDGPSPAARR